MSGQIAEFWASLGIKVDPKEIRKVDKFLKDTENKLKRGGKAKSQEAKASDQVVKAAKSEAAAKSATAKVDAAATKTIDQKTRATQRLTKAERERQRVEKRGRNTLLPMMSTQTFINSAHPSMGRKPLGARSVERKRLESFYGGLFEQANLGRVRSRNPLARETEALGRIGRNAPSFGQTGRVADHLRRRRVEGEVSALGRIGVNRGRVKPVGEALRRYDQSLEDSVQKGRRALADERHSRFVAGRREMMRGNLANLTVQGQQPRSFESKAMRSYYRQEESRRKRISNEELKASQQGLQHEREIERLRRQGRVDQRNANRQNRLTQATPRRHPQDLMRRSGASHASGNYLRAGGASGAFMRYGVGSLPFIGGAYGFSTLNRANQEAQVTRLTTQAVLQGQGYTEREGVEAFDWLRSLADDIGFSYMDAAQDYNQFLANSLGAGVDVGTSQDIFQGLSEYQTAMGTTSYRRKLINNALSQMMGSP